MDPSTAVIVGFAAQTLLIAGLFWQVNNRMDNRMDRLATKDDVANLENRTKERINENRERINDVKGQIGQLAWLVNDNRERLILIQGHLGIVLTVAQPAEAPPVEAPSESILASGRRG